MTINPEVLTKNGNGKFNPQKYLIKVKGKDYLEVKFRLHWFRQEKALWDIRTEIVKLDLERGIALVRADIYDEQGNHKSSGLKMEYQKNFFDYVEKAETGSIGRALASMGYGTLQSAELDEGIEAGRICDSPVGSPPNSSLPSTEKATENQLNYIKKIVNGNGGKTKFIEEINIEKLTKQEASDIINNLKKKYACRQ